MSWDEAWNPHHLTFHLPLIAASDIIPASAQRKDTPPDLAMHSTSNISISPRLFPAAHMPLQPFDFHTPTRVVFGPGTLDRLGEVARELGGNRALLVTDPGLRHVGHPQRAIAVAPRRGPGSLRLR